MSYTNRVAPLLLSSVDPTGIAIDTWTPFEIGGVPTDGIEEACFLLRVTNRCSSDIYISFDGVNRHQEIIPWDKQVLNFQTNSSPSGYVSKVRKFTKLYVQGLPDLKGGAIYLAGYYNESI